MKQKLLSKLLAIAMVLTLLPAGVFAEGAEGTNVAQIGDQGYATLQAAVDAAGDGQTVTLVANVTEDITIPAGKNVTLDLGNSTLTNKSGDTITVALGATLTVTGNGESADEDGSAGTVDNVTNGKADIVNNGTVILNGGWYLRNKETGEDADTSGGNSYYNILNHGEMTINNDTVVMQEGSFSSLIANGYYDYNGVASKGERNQYIEGTNQAAPKLTINNGLFSGGINTIKNDDNAELVIYGGVFGNVTQAVVQNNNVAEIHGGTFVAADHHAVENRHFEGNYNKGSITITDGNFTGALYTTTGATWNISGGTFTANPTAYLAKDCKIEMVGNAYGVVPNSDAVAQNGEKTFVSLQNAINDAKDGETITLLKDVDLGNTVTVANKTVTLNMAGKTIYNTKDLWDSKPNAWSLISVRENGNLTITGDGTLKAKANDCYALDTQEESAKLTVENGTVIGNISAIYAFLGEVTINGGSYSIQQLNTNNVQDGYGLTINCYDQNYKDKTAKITVTGGYFAHFDPANNKAEGAGTNFVADGYVSVTSDKSGYDYKVVQKTDTGSIVVKPAVADPEVKVDKIPQKDQETVKAAVETVSAPTLGAAAADEAQKIDEDKATALVNSATEVTGDKKLYVQTALKVEPTAYSAEDKTLTLEITPQYRVVASTATTADKIELDGNTKNAQVVQEYQELTITAPTVVTMELPTGFVADGVDKLSIKHIKDNGTVEYYTGKVTANGGKLYLTFTTNGFSPFVISAPAASIGENVYPTLQAAVDAAKNGETIKILKDNETAVVNRTVKFTVEPDGKPYTINLGAYCTDKDEAENVFDVVYTAPVYAPITKKDVKFDDVDVNAYYAPAVKWAVENKITAGKTDKLFAPDDTCTRGEMITFLWNAAGKPAAKNTTNPFTDVNAGAFYYDAVLWAVSNGITSGTTDTTFSPDNTVNRAQVVAFLYNYANKPAAANSTFSDVAADAYYAPAVGWAAAQKITSGTGNNTFSPENDCTRAQIVTFLYNDLAK